MLTDSTYFAKTIHMNLKELLEAQVKVFRIGLWLGRAELVNVSVK